jgi:hypothetical protein
MARIPTSSNTLPILTLVGAEILCLMAYVAACEVRVKEVAVCESRWAMALPAIALAGQSAATYFMDSGRQGSAAGGEGSGGLPDRQARLSRRWARGRGESDDRPRGI